MVVNGEDEKFLSRTSPGLDHRWERGARKVLILYFFTFPKFNVTDHKFGSEENDPELIFFLQIH